MQILTSHPERVKQLRSVILGPEPDALTHTKEYFLEQVRHHQDAIVAKLKGVEDRTAAETLRNLYVMVAIDNAIALEENEYYHYQLIGLRVVTAQDEYLGTIAEILETGANDVYVVRGGSHGEVLIPAIQSVVQRVDLAAEQVIINPLPGLLP